MSFRCSITAAILVVTTLSTQTIIQAKMRQEKLNHTALYLNPQKWADFPGFYRGRDVFSTITMQNIQKICKLILEYQI